VVSIRDALSTRLIAAAESESAAQTGWTALIVAVHNRRAETAAQLVRLGADVTVTDQARSDPAAIWR
jgi:hypothetical protein